MNSTNMLARHNTDGVSVNESAVCVDCQNDEDVLASSYDWWEEAEDTDAVNGDDTLYPVDNPDARCNGCATETREV